MSPDLAPNRFFRGSRIPAQECRLLNFPQLELKLQAETSAQPHLEPLLRFNHENVEVALKQCGRAPDAAALLDVGASIHAFALERAHALGVRNYVGIDLGITRHWGKGFFEITTPPQRPFPLLCL